jgi:hypothetical protein
VAELKPIPTAQRPSDPGYQPVSGYAVAAVVVAGLFAVILAAVAIYAVGSRRAILSWELLILPIAGVILAVIGRSHIRNSEGTKTGAKLASAAWWVCVLGGAGFGAYLYANEMVLERESARFTNKFLDDLNAGNPHRAFLSLMPPEERETPRVDPVNTESFEVTYNPAGYGAFKTHELVRLFQRNAGDVQYERIGVKEMGQTQEGFQAMHIYKLRCPEGIYEVTIRLLASESRKGGKQMWRIPSQPAPHILVTTDQPSQYGRLTAELELEATRFAVDWMEHLSSGRPALAHLMTTPLAHREPIQLRWLQMSLVVGGAVTRLPLTADTLPVGRRPGESGKPIDPFEELMAIGFFRRDAQNSPLPSDKQTRLKELWTNPKMNPAVTTRMLQPTMAPTDPVIIKVTPEAVTVVIPAELQFPNSVYYTRCLIGVVCTDADLIRKLTDLRAKGNDAPSDGSTIVGKLPQRDWRIAWLQTDMEQHSVVTGPGGGG